MKYVIENFLPIHETELNSNIELFLIDLFRNTQLGSSLKSQNRKIILKLNKPLKGLEVVSHAAVVVGVVPGEGVIKMRVVVVVVVAAVVIMSTLMIKELFRALALVPRSKCTMQTKVGNSFFFLKGKKSKQ